jgi:TfoX/Sxy family transcriptional regulator of competence genes
VAYNERLAARVRKVLANQSGVSERKMFGGLAFLLDGKMSVGVMGDDLMVRSGDDTYADALARPGARPMDFTGRVSKGMVYVAPSATSTPGGLRRWIDVGIAAARAAPSKKPRQTASRKRSN